MPNVSGLSLTLLASPITFIFGLLPAGAQSIPASISKSITAATDGTGTVITQQEGQFSIEAGSLSADGVNLFHSFESFSLTPQESASFVVNSTVQNVLSRISSASPSVIDGLLQVSGGQPNLYLMNPAGVLFGPNASLNLPGSLTVTSADAIGFEESWFNASGDNIYKSLVAAPTGEFAFLQGQPGAIANQGNLSLTTGASLTLLGGSVLNAGTLLAPGGTLTLAAPPGESTVSIRTASNLLTLELSDLSGLNKERPHAEITPLDLPALLTYGDRTHATELTVSADGTVHLGGNYREEAPEGEAPEGGQVVVWAKDIFISDFNELEAADSDRFNISEQSLSNFANSAGIVLEASNNITINPLSDQTLSFAEGEGSITFTADADNNGAGDFVVLDPDTTLLAPGRNLSISGQNLVLGDLYTAQITEGGNINLAANGSITAGNIYTHALSSVGQSGNVNIAAADVSTQTIYSRSASSPGNVSVTGRTGDISTGNIVTASLSSADGEVSLVAPNTISVAEEIIQSPSTGNRTSVNTDNLPIDNILSVSAPLAATPDGGSFSLQVSNGDSEDDLQVQGAKSTVMSNAEATAAIAKTEGKQGQKFSNYFGQNLPMSARSFEEVQQLLIEKEQESGTRSAIIYVKTADATDKTNGKTNGQTDSSLDQFTFGTSQKGPNALELMLITADNPAVKIELLGLKSEELQATVTRFRSDLLTSVRRGGTPYLASAQQLYQWLVAPIEEVIATSDSPPIDTLAFAMDTGLRTLPLAALHDGQQFLIEKYSLGMLPTLGLVDTAYTPLKTAEVTSTGASQFEQLEALPAVPLEVGYIHDQWPGSALLNEDFTRDNLIQQRSHAPTQVVHLATHAEFNAGGIEKSYIQLWDEKLRLNELAQLGWHNPAVDLLVLSACRTAIGSAEAELGFAGLAVASGVRSAVASLWSVDDVGTLALMSEFYRQLGTAPTKAEVLRQTQLALLNENVRLVNGQLLNQATGQSINLSAELGTLQDKDFSHPYYWSGFTMIGSPW